MRELAEKHKFTCPLSWCVSLPEWLKRAHAHVASVTCVKWRLSSVVEEEGAEGNAEEEGNDGLAPSSAAASSAGSTRVNKRLLSVAEEEGAEGNAEEEGNDGLAPSSAAASSASSVHGPARRIKWALVDNIWCPLAAPSEKKFSSVAYWVIKALLVQEFTTDGQFRTNSITSADLLLTYNEVCERRADQFYDVQALYKHFGTRSKIEEALIHIVTVDDTSGSRPKAKAARVAPGGSASRRASPGSSSRRASPGSASRRAPVAKKKVEEQEVAEGRHEKKVKCTEQRFEVERRSPSIASVSSTDSETRKNAASAACSFVIVKRKVEAADAGEVDLAKTIADAAVSGASWKTIEAAIAEAPLWEAEAAMSIAEEELAVAEAAMLDTVVTEEEEEEEAMKKAEDEAQGGLSRREQAAREQEESQDLEDGGGQAAKEEEAGDGDDKERRFKERARCGDRGEEDVSREELAAVTARLASLRSRLASSEEKERQREAREARMSDGDGDDQNGLEPSAAAAPQVEAKQEEAAAAPQVEAKVEAKQEEATAAPQVEAKQEVAAAAPQVEAKVEAKQEEQEEQEEQLSDVVVRIHERLDRGDHDEVVHLSDDVCIKVSVFWGNGYALVASLYRNGRLYNFCFFFNGLWHALVASFEMVLACSCSAL